MGGHSCFPLLACITRYQFAARVYNAISEFELSGFLPSSASFLPVLYDDR